MYVYNYGKRVLLDILKFKYKIIHWVTHVYRPNLDFIIKELCSIPEHTDTQPND